MLESEVQVGVGLIYCTNTLLKLFLVELLRRPSLNVLARFALCFNIRNQQGRGVVVVSQPPCEWRQRCHISSGSRTCHSHFSIPSWCSKKNLSHSAHSDSGSGRQLHPHIHPHFTYNLSPICLASHQFTSLLPPSQLDPLALVLLVP